MLSSAAQCAVGCSEYITLIYDDIFFNGVSLEFLASGSLLPPYHCNLPLGLHVPRITKGRNEMIIVLSAHQNQSSNSSSGDIKPPKCVVLLPLTPAAQFRNVKFYSKRVDFGVPEARG